MAIKQVDKYFLGSILTNPKVYYAKIKELIDGVNGLTDGNIPTDTITPASGTLAVVGNETVSGTLVVDGTLTANGNASIKGLFFLSDATPQTLTGAGAVTLTTKSTLLVTTGANALTMAAGTAGQIKIITMKTDGGDGTLTPTGLRGGTTITFSAVGQTATLIYLDSAWIVLSLVGAVLA